MMEYITLGLDKHENEGKIAEFLSDLNLPHSLDSLYSSNEISEYLWKRINEVQQKGGSNYLISTISQISSKSEELLKKLSDAEMILFVI